MSCPDDVSALSEARFQKEVHASTVLRREIHTGVFGRTLSILHCGIQIRMVAGFAEVIEREESLVAAVRFELTTFGL